jgi:hypothetical protein
VVTCRNISKVPLNFTMALGTPFSLDTTTMVLEPEQSSTVMMFFDPDFA